MPASPVNALSAALTGVSQLVRQMVRQMDQQMNRQMVRQVVPVGAAQSIIIAISIIIPGGGAGL
ncbi:MAG: hypothetical protein AAGF11_11810 [Myxococcota bacterium]